ncbi:MAG: lipid-A-disaccharide synthase N-terminal domain-containing protein [Methylophilaceae bacterium]|jgi:lipid-A-disaccharide synthase-like uncharacterized protein
MDHGIGYFLAHLIEALRSYVTGMPTTDLIWLGIGLVGQCLFMMRFIVQWIHSERHQQSLIPVSFWYLSLSGGLIVLAYGFHRADPVIILGQLPGTIVYTRNLMLLQRTSGQSNAQDV